MYLTSLPITKVTIYCQFYHIFSNNSSQLLLYPHDMEVDDGEKDFISCQIF